MPIVRWEPFRDLLTTQREFDRLFKEAFSPMSGETEVSTRSWAPPVDIYETEDAIVLKAELPGSIRRTWKSGLRTTRSI